ncbi:hypothetical protein [Amycolatopsis thermophila]|nr:hypothetical protein [Amycolatopsis thermophila]
MQDLVDHVGVNLYATYGSKHDLGPARPSRPSATSSGPTSPIRVRTAGVA